MAEGFVRLNRIGLLATAIAIFCVFAATSDRARAQGQPALTDLMESKEAAPTAAYYFGFLDRDGDGRIDRAEFLLQKMEVFFQLDKDRDTMLTGAEVPALESQHFRQNDSDGDGRLSSYEFSQSSFAKFELYDLNRDLMITLEELETILKSLR